MKLKSNPSPSFSPGTPRAKTLINSMYVMMSWQIAILIIVEEKVNQDNQNDNEPWLKWVITIVGNCHFIMENSRVYMKIAKPTTLWLILGHYYQYQYVLYYHAWRRHQIQITHNLLLLSFIAWRCFNQSCQIPIYPQLITKLLLFSSILLFQFVQ